MEVKELCEKFLYADKIINGEHYGNMTLEQIINDSKFKEYCPNSNCETNMQINGFGEYLFNQLRTEIKEEYYEYFMMWLSDKLFKIANDENNPQNKDITLNEAYDKYLKNNIQNGVYWIILDIKKGLKEANLKYMAQFYKLLNNICKAIIYYKLNDDDTEKFINYSSYCYNQYSSLYYSVSNCDSYLHLLDNLKKTYEDFKNSVHDEIKNEYPHLERRLKTLKIENTDSYFVKNFKEFDFNRSECKPQKAKTGEVSHQNGSEDSKSGKMSLGSGKGITDGGGGEKGGTSTNKEDSKGTNNEPIGTQNDQGKSSGGSSGGEGGGSKTPGDQDGTNSSGTSDGYWSITLGSHLNLLNYLPSASEIYETQKNILTDARNKITSAYSNTVDNIKYAYDRTVDSVTNVYNSTMTNINYAYTTSTNYISGVVSSITNQLNSLGSFSQLGDDQSKLGGPGNSLPTDNNPSSTTQIPKPDPNSSSIPQPQPPSVILPPSPSQLQQVTPQNTQTTNLQPQSGPTQDSSKIPDQNGGPEPIQSRDTNYTTDPSNTGSGIATGIVVKMNEKSLIWCIAQNKKYDILGIGIISISIFAFLAIMYKYLSLGCTRKSKRKKNMKKVINSIGGKRPVQIIIKSYDRNKDLKPIINSVDRKKDPLLNIYKLMQADPIPFINLFFLLIFFVYKRKYDFLEL
ncbi:PIR protein CIR protein [Plasmodium vinckei brucechwatti]|uniref:PIR protein CIR protein n=1 Tax=Plasmodium vinckei brucechwatti TaxID=119398 RepID=A0A6V7S2V4_PLAVN|nr:PIR protein CIR protein [Plasmodium vinckei brucechwatti]